MTSSSPRTRWEGRLALALALVAALRVLVFSLAFPFFTNVDEYRHLDVVLKYARGYWPTPGPDRYEPQTSYLVGRFGSPEYHREPGQPGEPPAPSWRQPDTLAERRVARMEMYLAPRFSLEADQPPVYYATAGAWLAAGRALGFEGLPLLYWVRLLGAGAAFALVWVSWWLLRDVYPQGGLVRLGVPALLACLPQDSMYYVTGDVFSPLLGGLAFLGALRLVRRPGSPAGAYTAAGLVLAAAFLCKYPSLAVAAACGFCTALSLRGPGRRGDVRRWALFWAAFLVPALVWLLRNQLLGGDLSGASFKVERLGWERKPPGAWLDHPIFTPGGLWIFLRDLTTTFWRGEVVWAQREIAWPPADFVYRATSFVFVALAALGLRRRDRAAGARVAEAAALVATLSGVILLALLSLLFVFGERTSPSAAYPYFVQGRLISSVLVPFALLYVRGIEEAARFLPQPWRTAAGWAVLAGVCGLALVSELVTSAPVFVSDYNAFHLP